MRPWALVLGVLWAASALAQTHTFEADSHTAKLVRQDKKVTLTWSAFFPNTTVERMVKAMADLKNAHRLVSGNKRVDVIKEKKAKGADLFIEKDGPFFLPRVTFEVKVRQSQGGGAVQVEWERVRGTADIYHRRWSLRAKDQGVEVNHRFELELPFDLPGVFVKGRLEKQMSGDVDALAGLVGVAAQRPKSESKPKG
jgi:hypothetical protein